MYRFQPILNNQQLLKLKEHKYSCVNGSLLDPYMNPFWIWLELKVPVIIHANAMTLAGLVVNLATTLVLVYYSPDAKTPAPSWAYLLCSLGIFIYQTLDAMDGKHARRTNTSSPLGELFDHGCDSLSTMFVVLGVFIALNLGEEPTWLVGLVFSTIALYYLAHWQTYVTGSLQFGKIDVTEMQFVCISAHVISAVVGAEAWGTEIPLIHTTFRGVVCWILVVSALANAWSKVMIILNGGPGRNGSAVGNMSILSPLFPFVFVFWQGYYVYTRCGPFDSHPLLFIFAFGVIMSKVTDRLVIAHMTQSEMRLLDSAYIVPSLMVAQQYWHVFSWIPPLWLLWACLIHGIVDINIYCIRVCMEIRDYLGIRVFSMEPLPAPGYLRAMGSTQQSQRRPLPARNKNPK